MSSKRQNCLVTIKSGSGSDVALSVRLVTLGGDLRRGVPGFARLVAEGGAGGYVYSISSGSLPSGMSLNTATGMITGTPTTMGYFEFTAWVTDAVTTIARAAVSMRIVGRLMHDGSLLPNGVIGVPYSYQFSVTGSLGAVTWTQTGGTIPAGLTLSGAGVLSGIPDAPDGTSYFTVRATDTVSGDTLDIAAQAFIGEALHEVADQPTHDLLAGVLSRIDLTPYFAGGVPPYVIEYQSGNLFGMAIRRQRPSAYWALVGTPVLGPTDNDVPVNYINIIATDSQGATAAGIITFSLRNPVNRPDAPADGKVYGRKDAAWVEAAGGGGGAGVIYADFDARPGFVNPALSNAITIPYGWTLVGWRIIAVQGSTGYAEFDILSQPDLGTPGVSIVGATEPKLSGAANSAGTDLTGWTTTGAAGSLVTFRLLTAAALRSVRIELDVTK